MFSGGYSGLGWRGMDLRLLLQGYDKSSILYRIR